MINAETCALSPLYLVVFRPGSIGLVSTFIAAEFLTIVWTRSDPGPRRGDDAKSGDKDRRSRPSVSHVTGGAVRFNYGANQSGPPPQRRQPGRQQAHKAPPTMSYQIAIPQLEELFRQFAHDLDQV